MNASFRTKTNSRVHQRPKFKVDNPGRVDNGGRCNAPQCAARIAPEKLMCAHHFAQVPEALRKRLISAVEVIEQSDAGDSHARASYERLRAKCIESLKDENTPKRAEVAPKRALENAQIAALGALEAGGDDAVDVAWYGFYGALQSRKICVGQMGIALRRWNAGELWSADELRAEIEGVRL